jgi:hypothetical protein
VFILYSGIFTTIASPYGFSETFGERAFIIVAIPLLGYLNLGTMCWLLTNSSKNTLGNQPGGYPKQ